MYQVTACLFCITADHDATLTLTKCCQCLNITIKKLINAVDPVSGECIVLLPILATKVNKYGVNEHLWTVTII